MTRTPWAIFVAPVLVLGCSNGTTPGPNQPAVPQPGGTALSVRDFGARGDGQTLDTAAVQQALEAVPDGGTLRFPSGTYKIQTDKGLVPKDNTRIELGDAVLVGDNVDGAICQIFLIRGRKGVAISGGTLVGSRSGHPRLGLGIYVDFSQDVVIEDVKLRNFYIDSIIVTGNTPCQRVQIRRCTTSNNRRTGLGIINATDITVEDSTFEGTTGPDGGAGLNVEPNKGDSVHNLAVRRCTFRKNTGVGLYVKGPSGDVTLEENVVDGSGSSGIVTAGVDGVTIANNHVTGHHAANLYGIVVGDTSTRATVTGNTLEDNSRGILTGATASEIRGNTITGMGPASILGPDKRSDGIVCQGVKTVLADCIVANNTVRQVASGIMGLFASGTQVLDNTLEDVGQSAITLRNAINSTVKGNTITRAGLQEAGRYDAIWLETGSSNNVITGNTIHQGATLRGPVGIAPGCNGNQVIDNVVLPY